MPKIDYIDYMPTKGVIEVVATANNIIKEYMAKGYNLTLRQLYYQFVARGYIANNERQYNRLGSILNKARLGGYVDWDAIEDRLRVLESKPHWDCPADIIKSAAKQFRLDSRVDQGTYIEVWVEKDALSGVLESCCPDLDVPYMSCRGYVSQSALWRAAQRFLEEEKRREVLLIYLGDHDPSGLDMSRDIQERLYTFGCKSTYVERIALNLEQVEQYNPPPNPAKVTDSRYAGYIDKYGHDCWELDALEPQVMVDLIKQAVFEVTDQNKQHAILVKENEYKKQLRKIAKSLNGEPDNENQNKSEGPADS